MPRDSAQVPNASKDAQQQAYRHAWHNKIARHCCQAQRIGREPACAQRREGEERERLAIVCTYTSFSSALSRAQACVKCGFDLTISCSAAISPWLWLRTCVSRLWYKSVIAIARGETAARSARVMRQHGDVVLQV